MLKKPIVIEAKQWDGKYETWLDISTWVDQNNGEITWRSQKDSSELIIPTLEGEMKASLFDWVIKGIHNEFYPCKPDIFAETYEVFNEKEKDDVGESSRQ
mgnify:CR=1 FL=1